jgi:hypothetical protein
VNDAYGGAGGLLGNLSRSYVEASIASALTDVIMASEQVANHWKRRELGGHS